MEFECPHCHGGIVVEEKDVACGIFRHASFRATGEQIPPHEKKEVCDQLAESHAIYGCGKPFQITQRDGQWVIQTCEYI